MVDKSDILEFIREEDHVEYYLFPRPQNAKDNKEEELIINSVLKEVKAIVRKHSTNYLWHRDEFSLSAYTSISNILSGNKSRESLPNHLHGVSHFGDNIEDEWFIVYLLIQLTKTIEGLIARVTDVDGEFLLIEAANDLPSWANPEKCDKRVYIYNGLIHIIAPEENNEEDEISVQNALKEIRLNPNLFCASPQIQNAIIKKIKDYPQKITDNQHRATVFLPVAIAAILKQKPNLVSPAVLAFCNRDSIDLRACRAMKYFPPENCVYTSIRFTKCLYAMLTNSKYVPDRTTGWNLPAPTNPNYKKHSLGVKIACGFEILASQAKGGDDIEGDKSWHTYLNSLKSKNYFKDLLDNSQEYNSLLKKAKDYYSSYRDSMYYTPLVGKEILELTRNLNYDLDEFENYENDLPPGDSEEWLNVSPEELDKMLMEQYGQKKISRVSNDTDASNFTRKITNFLDHVSDVEGAEFPTDEPPIRPPRNKKNVKNEGENKVNFDANSFSCAVQNILSFAIPEDDSWDLDSDSDMEDYGKEEPMEYGELKNKMREYMDKMDAELSQTTIGESFEKKENFDDIENFKPVDIDMNALKNILESYKSQMGEAGPSSTMLGPMGLHLEQEEASE